jgi:hypothetical protein
MRERKRLVMITRRAHREDERCDSEQQGEYRAGRPGPFYSMAAVVVR